MNTIVTTFQDIKVEAGGIQDFLEEEVPDSLEAIVERGNMLLIYIARTGKMKSDAKFYKDMKTRSAIMEQVKEMGSAIKLPASTLNSLVEAMCQEETHLLNWCDRLNRTATHHLGWLRTLVSKEKEEIRHIAGINNVK